MAKYAFLSSLRRRAKNSTIIRSSAVAFLLKISGLLVAITVQLVIARVLGDEEFGKYVYAISWVQLLFVPAAAGFPQAAVRLVPNYLASKKNELVRQYLRTSSSLILLSSVFVATIYIVVLFLIQVRIDEGMRGTLYLAAPLVIILSQTQLRSEALRGFKRFVAAILPLVVLRPAIIGIGIIALHLALAPPLTSSIAITLNIGSTLVVCIVMEFFLQKSLMGFSKRSHGALGEYRSWIAIALPLMLLGVFNELLNRTDILLIGSLVGTQEAGWYSVASRLATLTSFGLQAVSLILAPMISDCFARTDMQQLQRIIRRGAQLGFMATALAVLIIVVFSERLLGTFGGNFISARPALLILVAGQVVNSLAGSVGFLLNMTNQEVSAAKIVGVAALMNIALNVPFVLLWGMTGAAVATAISISFWNIAMVYVAWVKLGINPTIFSRKIFP